MKIGYCQFRPVFGEVEANVRAMAGLLAPVEADLMVLPELATTGYTFTTRGEIAAVAESFEDSPSLDVLAEVGRKKSCAIVAGFAEKSGGEVYNSAALLLPDGSRKLYRKIHLFGAETRFFAPGDIPFEVHDVGGVKVGMMICFDWFFPESARTLAVKGAQIICHAVNFVMPWGQQGMKIAALQNRLFIVTANRYGTETRGEFSFTFTGASQIATPGGEIPSSAPLDGDAVGIADIDPADALDKNINAYNDVIQSRRPEFYRGLCR